MQDNLEITIVGTEYIYVRASGRVHGGTARGNVYSAIFNLVYTLTSDHSYAQTLCWHMCNSRAQSNAYKHPWPFTLDSDFHTSDPFIIINRGSDCAQGNVPCFNYWGFFVMDLIIDIFFTADIAINFRTAFIDTGLVQS